MLAKYWYLNDDSPIRVTAKKTSEESWYLYGLDIVVDGTDLFRTSTGVLRALKRKIDEEIRSRQLEGHSARRSKFKPTRVSYLWLVEGGCK